MWERFQKKELHSFDQQFLSRICKFLLKKLKQKKIVKENQIKKDFNKKNIYSFQKNVIKKTKKILQSKKKNSVKKRLNLQKKSSPKKKLARQKNKNSLQFKLGEP